MASKSLGDLSRAELATMAQRRRIAGWKSLKKDDLIKALAPAKSSKVTKSSAAAKPAKSKVTAKSKDSATAKPVAKKAAPTSNPQRAIAAPRKTSSATPARSSSKSGLRNTLTAKSRGKRTSTITPSAEAVLKRDLAQASSDSKEGHDRFVVLVRDPHWLQVVWEFSRATIQRAEIALGSDWHRSTPTLRIFDVSGHDATSRSETRLLDIPIHGGVNFWYVPIDGQPRTYRLQIGYVTPTGKFQVLARSNAVTPPRPGTPGTMSGGWDDLNGEYQRVFALSGGYSESSPQSPVRELLEERLGHAIDSWNGQGAGDPQESTGATKSTGQLPLTFHAELILHGITSPDARVTVVDEPAHVKPDGSFQVRLALEDGRHLVQTVIARADGSGQRTIILSVERNTKELEAHSWEGGD